MGDKLVRDVMHQGLFACWADELLIDVARRLCEDSINALFVLTQGGHAKGVISQTDLADAYIQGSWRNRTAGELMSPEIITVTSDTPLDIAIEVMINQGVHRLLVVQEEGFPNRPIGVLSLTDVICEMAGDE